MKFWTYGCFIFVIVDLIFLIYYIFIFAARFLMAAFVNLIVLYNICLNGMILLPAFVLIAVYTSKAHVAHVFGFWEIKAPIYFLTHGESVLLNISTILHDCLVS